MAEPLRPESGKRKAESEKRKAESGKRKTENTKERRTEVAFSTVVRRFAFRVDQLPVWAFVVGAIAAFAMARAGRLFALLHQSRGGMELGGIATLAVFLGVVIFAVRRRQVSAWNSTLQVLGSLVAGNACAMVLVWPFVPDGYGIALSAVLRDTIVAGVSMMIVALPIGIGLLWLSRRYGSHSQLTERRRLGGMPR